MATVTRKIDDIDGTEAVETVEFMVQGQAYTIDLGDANREAFANAMAVFVAHATKVVHPVVVSKASKRSGSIPGTTRGVFSPEKLSQIREWASQNGHKVAPVGRIAATVLEAYQTAQKEEAEDSSAERSVIAQLTKDVE